MWTEDLTSSQAQSYAAMPSPKPSRVLKWMRGFFAGFGLLIAMMAWFYLPLGPLLYDGPFYGAAIAAINDRTPDQAVPIWGGNVLEVFDSTSEGVSATVQLRSADRSVRWAILADGHKPGDVHSIRFSNVHRGMARSGAVQGMVDWTYGHEATCWFITGGGGLRDYWYSW